MPELVTQFATDIAEPLKKVTHVEKSEKEVLAQVAALDPRDFIDVKVPLESSAITSVAWKALFAKPAMQAVQVLNGVGWIALNLYFNSTVECLGWDGTHHPEYVWTSSWAMWSDFVFPTASTNLHIACGNFYCMWHRNLAGATLRHGIRRPFMVAAAWLLGSALVLAIKIYAIGMTKDEQERSCMVMGNESSSTEGVEGLRFEGEGLQFVGEKAMMWTAVFAVIAAAAVAVTYTGKRGLVAWAWFWAVFGLP
jgi:hypothetical protein